VRYGKGEINRFFLNEYGLERMALHASQLELIDESGNELVLRSLLPEDLMRPLEKLGIEIPRRFSSIHSL
jgi:hypothetical protein